MSAQPEITSLPAAVLVVCTGNICRSPLAEQLLRQEAVRLGLSEKYRFSSAGTYAEVGRRTHPETIASAARRGIEIDADLAQQVTPEMVRESSLILTATAEHRSDIVQMVPGANKKAYTIKEFERILRVLTDKNGSIDPEVRWAVLSSQTHTELFGVVAKYRGYAPRFGESEDVLDPYGTNPEFFDVVTDELIQLTRHIMALLGEI